MKRILIRDSLSTLTVILAQNRVGGEIPIATTIDHGKSPELIAAPSKFKNDPSAALDKIFREIAWKAVVEHPLSGVTDKNKNGIGDHLE
jgi:hypothetical protein